MTEVLSILASAIRSSGYIPTAIFISSNELSLLPLVSYSTSNKILPGGYPFKYPTVRMTVSPILASIGNVSFHPYTVCEDSIVTHTIELPND